MISHIDYVAHSFCLRSADDVTIDYTVDYVTWPLWHQHMKSDNSLDIDLIYSHIYGCSCKKTIIFFIFSSTPVLTSSIDISMVTHWLNNGWVLHAWINGIELQGVSVNLYWGHHAGTLLAAITVHPMNHAHGSHFVVFCCGYIPINFNPYPSGLLHWHWDNLTISPIPVPMKRSQSIWLYVSHESTKSDDTTIKNHKKTMCTLYIDKLYISLLCKSHSMGDIITSKYVNRHLNKNTFKSAPSHILQSLSQGELQRKKSAWSGKLHPTGPSRHRNYDSGSIWSGCIFLLASDSTILHTINSRVKDKVLIEQNIY